MDMQASPPHEWPAMPEPFAIDQFLELIAESAKVDRAALVPEATMESLGIASLDMVDILFAMEEQFNVYVPMGDELSNVTYLADLVSVLAQLIEEGAAEPGAQA